jgi:hypothetical protein
MAVARVVHAAAEAPYYPYKFDTSIAKPARLDRRSYLASNTRK